MGNEDDASDMAQEALVKAFRFLKDFNQKSKFGTWLYRIATNTCLDELRKKKKIKEKEFVSIDASLYNEEGDEISREYADTSVNVEHILEQKELISYIHKLINEMKEEYRVVLVLRDIMELSYEEISSILGISVGTLKSRINRARNELKHRIDFEVIGYEQEII